jgi:DNA-binding NarL/FixJ family response regulator
MSGLEMKRALNAVGDDTTVIFLTAHDGPAVRAEAMQAGCAGFFSKTEDGTRILETLRTITGS